MMQTHWVVQVLAAICCATASASAAPAERFSAFAEFTLWSTTLAQVQEVLGPAPVATSGDASSFNASICYRARGAFVVFYSGEMSGGVQMEGVSISKELPAYVKCIRSTNPDRLKNLEVDGLELGMSKAQFAKIAPPGVTWTNDEATASRIVSIGGQPPKTEVTTIGAKFKGGKVVKFYVSNYEVNE